MRVRLDARINCVEWACLSGERPRPAGSNARLGEHGATVQLPLVRLYADDGTTGFGLGRPDRELAESLLGLPLSDIFVADHGVVPLWHAFDYAVWDLVGRQVGAPVYALAATFNGKSVPRPNEVPCYDTSLYFDDLHCADDQEAAALIAAEAEEGYGRGHRAFKVKVGRGARHLPIEEGTRRDIAVVRAVRAAIGPECWLMLDANNGYTLNLTKRVLADTADCHVFWIEEPFHEDAVLFEDLRSWLTRQNLPILIADGEGEASPSLLEWARRGLVDVIQYDIAGHGFTRWLEIGPQLDGWRVRSAPHHYGRCYGNYAACHLAGAIEGFTYAEWDEAEVPGLDASAYAIKAGKVSVPDTPGFGLHLDEDTFRRAVETDGFRCTKA
jgi:L-rhamnonate dehydratase